MSYKKYVTVCIAAMCCMFMECECMNIDCMGEEGRITK